jgi:hypothetical protein
MLAMGFTMIMTVCGAWAYTHYKQEFIKSDVTPTFTTQTTTMMQNLTSKVKTTGG